jgi:hypothetical protein
MKEIINNFLSKFCTKVSEDEDSATTELYMDDHDCIEFEDVQYYVPKNNSSYTEDDELTREMLVATFSV